MYGKSNMETYITICNIDSQWEFAVWLRKLKQVICKLIQLQYVNLYIINVTLINIYLRL